MTAPNRWTVATEDTACHRCDALIVAGEQCRFMGPRNLKTCIDCAKKAGLGDPPADMPIVPTLPTLKEPEEWFEPKDFMPPLGQVLPPLASAKQRARIIAARKRLETTPGQRDWWND